MTFASPPPSLSLGSDPPATAPLSPLEEMKLYEQENPSQKHRRSEESGDDRLTAQLWKVAKQWKTHREAGKVHMSLRVTVAMFILGQIKQQAEALRLKAQSEELVDSEALWLKAWSYLSWDTQSKQNVRNEEATPVDHGTMLLQLNRLLTLIPQDNVLHRFHSSGDRVHHGYWFLYDPVTALGQRSCHFCLER
eukprot:s445_g19.t1